MNGAQIVIDQFIVSGPAKWGQTSRLTLLLPHGYEGNGPEHSSARLERFLQLAAEENIRVANPSSAAQYFHLLRRQALDPSARPLVVMTPKGLLRLKEAASSLDELTDGRSGRSSTTRRPTTPGAPPRRLLGEALLRPPRPAASADAGGRRRAARAAVPVPGRRVRRARRGYPALEELVWAQEEPQNMGAVARDAPSARRGPGGVPLRYIGRQWRASTSEGYPTTHAREQERIVREALSIWR